MDFVVTGNDITRELRISSLSPFNRLCSIVHDSLFVDRISSLLPNRPLGGNLRAGRWYIRTEKMSFECCFKSTDGHYGQWNFSLWRCNLQLLKLLFVKGGAIIVDTTRQGKRFPDSLSKTVPIWCFVVNQLLVDLGVLSDSDFNVSLCLPQWVSKEEKHWILERSKSWLATFRERKEFRNVLLELVSHCTLKKPLKPMWICRDDPNIEETLKESMKIPCVPIFCVSVSSPNDNYMWLTRTLTNGETYGFCYIQGAGDDEESWSCGLFPELFWRHEENLLSQDPAFLKERIGALLEKIKAIPVSIGKNPNRHIGHLELLRVDEENAPRVHLFWDGWVSMEIPFHQYFVDVHIVLSIGDRNSPLVDCLSSVQSMFGDTCNIICVKVVDRAGRLESKRFGLERALKEVSQYLDSFLLRKKKNVMIWSPFHTDWATCCVLSWLAIRSRTRCPQKMVKQDKMHRQIWLVGSEQQKMEDKIQLITIFWWLSLSFDISAPSRSAVQQMHRLLFKSFGVVSYH